MFSVARRRRDTLGAVAIPVVAAIAAAAVVGVAGGVAAGVATSSDSGKSQAATVSAAAAVVLVRRCPNGDPAGALHANDRVFVTGRDRTAQWLQVRDANDLNARVWLLASDVAGDRAFNNVRVTSCASPVGPGTSTSSTSTTSVSSSTTTSTTATTVPGSTAPPATTPGAATVPPTNPPATTPKDTTPPSVHISSTSSSSIYENDPTVCPSHPKTFVVHATAGDASGIGSVVVKWSVTGHSGQITMARVGGEYQATVGPFATSTVAYPTPSAPITVTVRAVDGAGNAAQASTTVTLYDCTFI